MKRSRLGSLLQLGAHSRSLQLCLPSPTSQLLAPGRVARASPRAFWGDCFPRRGRKGSDPTEVTLSHQRAERRAQLSLQMTELHP